MESTAAATEHALSKLDVKSQAAHQQYCQYQKLAQDEAQLLERGLQNLRRLHLATAGACPFSVV